MEQLVSEEYVDMDSTQQSEIDKLKNRVKDLETQRITQPTSHPVPQPQKSPIVGLIITIVLAVLAVAGFSAGAVWIVHEELSRRDETVGKIDKRIVGLTMAIKVIGDAQGGKTKELVDDALEIAKLESEAGHTEKASNVISLANELVAEHPLLAENQFAAKKLISDSIHSSIKIPELVVEKTGKSFIEASQSEPRAWDVALDFLTYRSSLNTPYIPPTSNTVPRPDHSLGIWIKPLAKNYKFVVLESKTFLPLNEAARMWEISETYPLPIQKSTEGPAYYVIDGSNYALSLDNMHLKNVVIVGAQISYQGGASILENVSFVNCTFRIERGTKGEELAARAIETPATYFSAT